MAQRRMFAQTIIDSDAFLDMPNSAQNLYFHLGMKADDDGVINNPRSIMRNTRASDDDMKILISKKFIIDASEFGVEGVVVVKHWKINNYIQSDRYTKSKYLDMINKNLKLDENKAYTSKKDDVYTLDTQVSIVKLSIDEDNINTIVEKSTKEKVDYEELFEVFWKCYPKKASKGQALKTFTKLKPTKEDVDKWIKHLALMIGNNWYGKDIQYIPHASTWLNAKGYEDEIIRPSGFINNKNNTANEQVAETIKKNGNYL